MLPSDHVPATTPSDIPDDLAAALGRLVLLTSSQAVVGVDTHGRVRLFSAGAEQLFGQCGTTVLGRPVANLLSEQAPPPGGAPSPEPGSPQEPYRTHIRRPDGRCVDVDVVSAAVAAGTLVERLLLICDSASPMALTSELRRLAYHDSVTDLPNRAYLMARLRDAMARADANEACLALLFVDFDRFKEVNDTLGHERGDEVLRILGQRLTAAVRPRDLVARHGGDEFIVLMETLRSRVTATRVASRILHALREPVRADNRQFAISVSIGIALYPDTDADPAALLRRADAAMYSVKRAGGDAFRCAIRG